MLTDQILATETAAARGAIGLLTLNAERSLNALNLDMVKTIQLQLNKWRIDDNIAAIWIDGTGDKAFCAGGDVQALYHSAMHRKQKKLISCEYAEAFFLNEYAMNFSLHTYPKPIICFGHGIVMGGGLGILAGCSHRIITEKSRIAMPEVSIALFPDVGGSWFLNHMPGSAGLFLALTGASMNAADAIFTGIADYCIDHTEKQALLNQLAQLSFGSSISTNHQLLDDAIKGFNKEPEASSDVENHFEQINKLCCADTIEEIANNISTLETQNSWLQKAKEGLFNGSPLAIRWIYQQLQISAELNLREVFLSELILATNIVRHDEFQEGVRALLIDKDRKPQWQHNSIGQCKQSTIDDFFKAPWKDNPLAKLI